jgi:hypothetical protein
MLVVMEKNKRQAEEAEDRERMARILKRHEKPAKKEAHPEDVKQPAALTESAEH